MKKFFALLLALTLALSLPACGSKTDNDGSTLDQTPQQETDGDDTAGNTPDQSQEQEDNEDDTAGNTPDQSQEQEDNKDDNDNGVSDQTPQQGENAGDNGGSTSDQSQQQKPAEGSSGSSTPGQSQQEEPAEGGNSGSEPDLPPQQEPVEDDNNDSTPEQPQQQEAPDLNKFFGDFMISLGDDAPGMIDLTEDDGLLDQFYPGLTGYTKKQTVVQGAAISAVAFEFALVEVANAADVQAVSEILQSRMDSQAEGGAFYPALRDTWSNARVITHGNIVALICAGDQQAQAEEMFSALFE